MIHGPAPGWPRFCAPRRNKATGARTSSCFAATISSPPKAIGNYQSMRMDGTPYRNLRDYGEVGFTRVFPLAKDSWLEASVRGHRVEHDYDYSFRIFAVAKLRID